MCGFLEEHSWPQNLDKNLKRFIPAGVYSNLLYVLRELRFQYPAYNSGSKETHYWSVSLITFSAIEIENASNFMLI